MKTLEKRRIEGNDAANLLKNELLQGAFDAVGEYLESQALSCDPDNKDKSARIICAKQILAGIKREITRYIEDGGIAEIQLQEVERKKRMFQFVR